MLFFIGIDCCGFPIFFGASEACLQWLARVFQLSVLKFSFLKMMCARLINPNISAKTTIRFLFILNIYVRNIFYEIIKPFSIYLTLNE